MNPFKLFRLLGDYNEAKSIAKEKASVHTKVTQYVSLFLSLSATVGLPTLAANWLQAHTAVYTGIVAAAIVLHAIFPSIFAAPSQPVPQESSLNKVSMFVLAALLLSMAAHGQTATATTTTAPTTATASSNGFSGSSAALAVDYKGAWSVGTLVQESFDFVDFGAKANHLYVVGNEFLAPTPGFSLYTGGLRIEPNLSGLLSKTNVPAGSLGCFAEASIGSGIPATGGSQIGWLLGGGVKYQLTPSLSWQSLQVQYGGIGAQRVAAISTGLSFVFAK